MIGADLGRAPAATGWPDHPRLHLFLHQGDAVDVKREAARRSVVVLDASQFDLAARFKAANPAIRVLVSKDLSSTRTDAGAAADGVSYVDADKNHPDWFALDPAGRRVEWAGQPGHWWMDTGNPSYQQAWLSRVGAELKEHHWDGVVLESALTTLQPHLGGGHLQRYGTDAALQGATRAMLATVGPGLTNQGFDVIAHITDARRFRGLWKDWLTLVDGAAERQFVTFPGGVSQTYLTDDDFQQQLDQIADAESARHRTFNEAVGSGSDRRARTYGLAAFLLVTDGSSTFAYSDTSSSATYPPELNTAAKLGAPDGRYTLAGARIYRRRFAGGVVVVNASRDQPAEVTTNHGLRTVRPASAIILLDHDSAGRRRTWLAVVAVLLILVDGRLVMLVARRNRARLAALRR